MSCVDGYSSLLRDCANRRALDEGRRLHAEILRLVRDGIVDGGGVVVLTNLVVEMYGKCRSLAEARHAFDALGWRRNVFSWTIMTCAYTQNGHFGDALHLFRWMDVEGVRANSFTLSSIAVAYAGVGNPSLAKSFYTRVVCMGLGNDEFVATAVIAMFCRCDCWINAKAVFDGLASKSTVSWNAVITAAVQGGEKDHALKLLQRMDCEGTKPDHFTLTTILSACSSISQCREFHARIRVSGFHTMLVVQNALMDCYGKCGSICDAKTVFDEMLKRDVISWTCLIASYVHNDESRKAIAIYELMEESSQQPNVCTLTAVVEACSIIGELERGRSLYSLTTTRKLARSSLELGAAVVNMFVRCGSHNEAKVALRDLCISSAAAWNFVISSIAQDGSSAAADALELFSEMALEGTKADSVTFAAVVSACSSHKLFDRGKLVHDLACIVELDRETAVGAAVVTMYSRSGRLDKAWETFEKIRDRTVVAWSSLMTGYAQQGHNQRALQLYKEMISGGGVVPDKFTFSTILGVCAELGAAEEGRLVHSQMLLSLGLEQDAALGTSLMDMLAKCGNIDAARIVFDQLPERNSRTWTTLIAGLARHGRGEHALHCLYQMTAEGLVTDQATVTTMLHGCNHGGLVDAGRCCFRLAIGEHGIQACREHYDCVVDLLGRAGRLKEAEKLAAINDGGGGGDGGDNSAPWRILLGGCRIHGDLEVASRAAPKVVEQQQQSHYYYSHVTLLSNIYSDKSGKESPSGI